MIGDSYKLHRNATERLKAAVKARLKHLDITPEGAARQARIPAHVFRSLISKNMRPSLDRADELCWALGITFTLGPTDKSASD